MHEYVTSDKEHVKVQKWNKTYKNNSMHTSLLTHMYVLVGCVEA